MSAVNGDLFRLKAYVAAVPVAVLGMDDFSRDFDAPVSQYPTFDNPRGESVAGQEKDSYSVSGLYDPTDEGQAALIEAAESKTEIDIQVLPNGTTGFKQTVRVSKFSHKAKPGAPQTVTYAFEGTSAKTDIPAA